MSSLLSALAEKLTKRTKKTAKFQCHRCHSPLLYNPGQNIFYCMFCRIPYSAAFIQRIHS